MIIAYLATALLFAGIVGALLWAETKIPIERDQPRAEVVLDYKMVALNVFPNLLLSPILCASSTAIVNAMGGGLIELSGDGWRILPSVLVFILAVDLFAYAVHRAQHAIPFLWSMHSLHHSAEAVRLVTGARHYWIEQMILTAFFPVIAVIFKAPENVVTIAALLYFLFDGCVHLNVKLRFGPMALCINNPQFHRIHHSIRPEHRDKNFCKLLPIIDVVFGTAWRPARDEFPATGLPSHERPTGWIDGILWPLRRGVTLAQELPPTRSTA